MENSISTPEPSNWRAYLALVAAIAILSTAPIFLVAADAPGPVSSLYRLSTCALILAPAFFSWVSKNGGVPRQGLKLAALAGLCFGLDMATWSTGVMMSGAAVATLLSNMSPVWVGLGAFYIFKERLNKGFWAGLLLAILGMVAVIGFTINLQHDFNFGTFWAVSSSLFYGGFFLFSQGGRQHIPALPFLWISTTAAALVNLVVVWLFHYPLTGYSTQTYLNFLALGLVVQTAGWFIINYAQGILPASLVSPTLLGQPVGAAILAWFLLGERLSAQQIVGSLTVLIGIYIVHRSRHAQEQSSV